MTVHSDSIGRLQPPAGVLTALYTATASEHVILKSAVAFNASGVNSTIQCYVSDPSTGTIGVALFETVANLARAEWQGWLVMRPGDVLYVFAQQAGVSFWCSGTHLRTS